jgi:[acyl-carrier-protein] S-malonyltransferase
VIAVVCPGQGSQTPGFLQPWLELPGVEDQLGALSEAVGIDLLAHGTVSDAETIRDTAVAQPLIVAAGLIGLRALIAAAESAAAGSGSAATGRPFAVTAGHSVGEITAAAAAGVITEAEAVRFVAVRGRAMAKASATTPTGMSAVLGGDPDEVSAVLNRHGLTAANRNGAGQIVAAGTLEQLAALAADPPAKARVIALQVAGAFHTQHMTPAVDELAELAATLSASDPAVLLLSNADGAPVTSGAEMLARLVGQVSNPVRWDLCMATMQQLGVSTLIELPPAGTLSNLAKRALPGVATIAVKTPGDLATAVAAVTTGATA